MTASRKQKNDNVEDHGNNLSQIFTILNASMTGITSGIVFAWPSPFIIKISEDKDNYDITTEEASYFPTMYAIGLLILPPFLVPVINIIGRKNTLLLSTVPHALCFIIKIFGTNLWLLYFARLCSGFGDAMLHSAIPAYVGEVATPEIRGVWGNSFICLVYVGQLLVNIVGSYFTVQETSYLSLLLIAVFFITFIFRPESPYFYIMKNKEEEARNNLKRLRRKHNVEAELEDIKAAVKTQMAEKGTYKELITVKANRRALTAAVFLRISQLLTGIYIFTSYTQLVFEKAGGNVSAQASSIIYISVVLVSYVTAAFFSDKLGRRKAYMISIFLAAIIVFFEGVYFYIDSNHSEINLSLINWFPLVGMIVFVIISAFGIGLIPTLMLGELFSANIKVQGVSTTTVVFATSTIVVNNVFYYFNEYTGLYGPFLLFACCNVISAVLAYFLVPETKGKTLEEIQIELRA